MPFDVQIFLSLNIISVTLSIVLLTILWPKRSIYGARSFSFFGLTTLIWTIGNTFTIIFDDLHLKSIGLQIEYFGVPYVPILWSIGTIQILSNGKHPSKNLFRLSFIIPVLTTFFMLFNEKLKLLFVDFNLLAIGNLNSLQFEYGIWFHVNVIYSYLFLFATLVALIISIKNSASFYRKQKLLILASLIPPWSASILYLNKITNFYYIDFTPITFTFTFAMITLAIIRYGLFDIIPAARERVIESMEDSVLVLDKQDRIIDMNPAAVALLGQRQAIGHRLRDIFPNIRALKRLTGDSRLVQNEITIDNKIFEILSSAIMDKSGADIGSVYTFRDISKRKRTENELRAREQELAELNRTKDKFFSIISHDLKNPFQSILGYTQMLKEEYSSLNDNEKMEIVEGILNISKKTQQLLDNLLHWSRVQTNKIKLQPEEIELNELLSDIFDMLSIQAKLKNVSLQTNISSKYVIRADFDMLSTILRNLVSNGIKFSNINGKVIVNVEDHQNYLIFKVIDNGIGMSQSTLNELFTLKKSVSEKGTNGERGTGLGLILTKEFVEKHGGKIWLNSEEGKGTQFGFSIPKI